MKNPITVVRKKNIEKLSCDFGTADCVLVVYERQVDIRMHTHEFDELVVVLSGTGLHVADEGEYPLVRGDVFVIHGKQKHCFRDTRDLHLANIIYKKDYFEKLKDEFFDLPGFRALFVNEPLYRKNQEFKSKLHLNSQQLNEISKFIHLFEEENKEKSSGYTKFQNRIFEQIVIKICRFFSETVKPKSKALINISLAMDFMEKNYTDPITIETLAKKIHMSESNFRHKFKFITGLSPIHFLIRLRIEKATELILNNSELNVTEIAMKVGFDDSAYFSRQFKKIIGVAPLEYIKQRRHKVKPNILD